MVYLTFGERIALLRRRKGLTQTELAEQAGITQNTIARVERGSVKTLQGTTVGLVADALETSTDYLLGRTEESSMVSDAEPTGVAMAGR